MSQLSVLSIRYIVIPSIWNKFDSFYHYQTTNTYIYNSNGLRAYSFYKVIDSNYTSGSNIYFTSLVCVDAKMPENNYITYSLGLSKPFINTYLI